MIINLCPQDVVELCENVVDQSGDKARKRLADGWREK
jgi:hypothetical protein